jgi:hypothetical protein
MRLNVWPLEPLVFGPDHRFDFDMYHVRQYGRPID